MLNHTITMALLLTLSACSDMTGDQQITENEKWYKGNTHVHTTLSGHADTTKEEVAKWYLDRDYNFLILSEHNKFIDPTSVQLPEGRRKDFILIPGEEATDDNHVVHSTSMNIKGLVPWNTDETLTTTQSIQHHIDGTLEPHGTTILNHPNFEYAVTASDILGTHDLYMFELYNGHHEVHNFGDDDHVSTEIMWDDLLSHEMKIYGVSSDDAHQFQTLSPNLSNPGRGWVMVKSDDLTPDSITAAMLNGDFYASSGVTLKTIPRSNDSYSVTADIAATLKTLTSPVLRGKYVLNGQEGFRIEFIGPEGEVLSTIMGESAIYSVTEPMTYLRVRIIYTRNIPKGGYEEYYAWGQPVFNAGS